MQIRTIDYLARVAESLRMVKDTLKWWHWALLSGALSVFGLELARCAVGSAVAHSNAYFAALIGAMVSWTIASACLAMTVMRAARALWPHRTKKVSTLL
jgi:uncharacterized BrkB/YihY/UPF0761 family membrane protein